MSLVVMATCDGDWHGFPCRGAIPAHRTVPLMAELREKATAAGWLLTPDGDYCPAHARREGAA